jgi:hypothetical protein
LTCLIWRHKFRVMSPRIARRSVVLVSAMTTAAVIALVAGGEASAQPIPEGPGNSSATAFIGSPAKARPVSIPVVPTNPFMAPVGTSNIHNDTYMSDSYQWSGPLGKKTKVTSTWAGGECASITFNAAGQLIAICLTPQTPAYLTLMDPGSLKVLTRYNLTNRPAAVGALSKRDYTELSGGYFYLDNLDRPVVATADRHLITFELVRSGSKYSFQPVSDVDLNASITAGQPTFAATGDSILSALPDFKGNVWFVTTQGLVGALNPTTGVSQTIRLENEGITQSFSMDETGGVFIVSNVAMYRFDAAADTGTPTQSWRTVYANVGGEAKPGQKSAGSGTSPTVMSGGRVAITDNADPMNVVVYNTAINAPTRLVCLAPVFNKGASATENSLISIGDALIVENNYGNLTVQSPSKGKTTTPGFARVDVQAGGTCKNVWTNTKVSAPSVVPKFSAATGLIYTYTKPKGPGKIDRWYWTALDYRTGGVVYSKLAGTGNAFNNSYASLYVAPNGVGYVGVLKGLIRVEDRG